MKTPYIYEAPRTDLHRSTVMIVDENAYAGTEMFTLVETHNGNAIGPIATIADGVAMVKAVVVDAAVVDGDMGECNTLLAHLDSRQIPYIVRGYVGPDDADRSNNRQRVLLSKPVEAQDVLSALARIARPTVGRYDRNYSDEN